jgi:two-component system nitrate/nitrite sensor histidine kinase NarX
MTDPSIASGFQMAVSLPDVTRWHSISVRIVVVSLLALGIALAMIGGTLWLSWQLEGGAAAINDAGSVRMRSFRLALVLQGPRQDAPRALQEIASLEQTLTALQRGDPARPLVLPGERSIRIQYEQVDDLWTDHLADLARRAAGGDGLAADRFGAEVDDFVAKVDVLVSAIEHDNARKTGWLRLSQAVLIAIAIMGTVTMIYLLYLWIIRPVLSLQAGISTLAAGGFDARVPVETRDEFGALASGFNAMAEELQGIYRDLEQRVRDKTGQLEAQNHELAALYEMAAFLSRADTVEAQSGGFVQRVMSRFSAEGASLRIQNPADQQLQLVVAEGLSAEILGSTQCRLAHDCVCGEAGSRGHSVMHDFRHVPRHAVVPCSEAGFKHMAVFRITSPQATLGSFALHFRHPEALGAGEIKLLETLGQQLGTAIENARLRTHERLLAVSEERNLVAQGLHDSLAQSLNFLNLQVQMLEKALQQAPHPEAGRVLPGLRAGIAESYNDVRELLANFRTRLGNHDVRQMLQAAVVRFQEQSGVVTVFDYAGGGTSLSEEQRLQILFILQEALSNIRKHARTSNAVVKVRNQEDFSLEIVDLGCGFDVAGAGAAEGGRQIGLHIMRERAARIGAELVLWSAVGQGTQLKVLLRASARQTA